MKSKGRKMSKAAAGFVFLLTLIIASSHAFASSYEFNFDDLPWDKTADEIKEMVKGCACSDMQSLPAPQIFEKAEEAKRWYSEGLIDVLVVNASLETELISVLSVHCEDWKSTFGVTVFFLKDTNRPFLIEKQVKYTGMSYTRTFNMIKRVVDKKTGAEPEIADSAFHDFETDHDLNGEEHKSILGRWKTEKTHIILCSIDGNLRPLLLYLNVKGWSKYLEQVEYLRLKMERLELEKLKKLEKSFESSL